MSSRYTDRLRQRKTAGLQADCTSARSISTCGLLHALLGRAWLAGVVVGIIERPELQVGFEDQSEVSVRDKSRGVPQRPAEAVHERHRDPLMFGQGGESSRKCRFHPRASTVSTGWEHGSSAYRTAEGRQSGCYTRR
jgi:hypothetical protein